VYVDRIITEPLGAEGIPAPLTASDPSLAYLAPYRGASPPSVIVGRSAEARVLTVNTTSFGEPLAVADSSALTSSMLEGVYFVAGSQIGRYGDVLLSAGTASPQEIRWTELVDGVGAGDRGLRTADIIHGVAIGRRTAGEGAALYVTTSGATRDAFFQRVSCR
jgi:hypothetical protein